MDTITTILLAALGLAALVLFGFILKWLWNWLIPSIFSLRKITYWEALGLFLLTHIFFGGFDSSDDECSPVKAFKSEYSASCEKRTDNTTDAKFREE